MAKRAGPGATSRNHRELTATKVQAPLALLEPAQPISDDEFARKLAEALEEDTDDATVARVLSAKAEQGEVVWHGEMKHQLSS